MAFVTYDYHFLDLDFVISKPDNSEFTSEEMGKFHEALIDLVESFGYESAGGISIHKIEV